MLLDIASMILTAIAAGCLVALMFFFIASCFSHLENLFIHHAEDEVSDCPSRRSYPFPDPMTILTQQSIEQLESSSKTSAWTSCQDKGSAESLPPAYEAVVIQTQIV